MNKKLDSLIKYVTLLIEKRFTGDLRIKLHKGDISNRVDKTEPDKICDGFDDGFMKE